MFGTASAVAVLQGATHRLLLESLMCLTNLLVHSLLAKVTIPLVQALWAGALTQFISLRLLHLVVVIHLLVATHMAAATHMAVAVHMPVATHLAGATPPQCSPLLHLLLRLLMHLLMFGTASAVAVLQGA